MTAAREFLAAVQQRADAATDGPWEHRLRTRSVIRTTGFATAFGVVDGAVAVTSSVADDDDAEFIAAARTDVPRLVATVEAVLDLHRPETDDDAPDGWPYCTACGVDAYEEPIPWPCETVRAIDAALTPKENDS